MNAHIDIPRDEIAAFCKRWQVTELVLFGSVLRDDFDPESDGMYWCILRKKSGILCST